MDSSSDENVKDQWDEDEDDSDGEEKFKTTSPPGTNLKNNSENLSKPKATAVSKPTVQKAENITIVTSNVNASLEEDTIDLLEPTNKEQFDKLESLLKEKLIKYDKSAHYIQFLDGLLKDLCQNMEMDDVKKISTTLMAVSNEKLKQSKNSKIKKKGKKVALTAGKDADGIDYDYTNDYDAYEDYL